MTRREHFERWMRYVKPNLPLDYNEKEGYYHHDIVSLAWQAWQESPNRRPTELGKVTKERVREMLVDPETIVDRLRGVYPHDVTYPVNPLQKAAAAEIERLQAIIKERG